MIRQVILAGKVAINSATKLYTWGKYYKTSTYIKDPTDLGEQTFAFLISCTEHAIQTNYTCEWVGTLGHCKLWASCYEYRNCEGWKAVWPYNNWRPVTDIPIGSYFSDGWKQCITAGYKACTCSDTLYQLCAIHGNQWTNINNRNFIGFGTYEDCCVYRNVTARVWKRNFSVDAPGTFIENVTSYNESEYPNSGTVGQYYYKQV